MSFGGCFFRMGLLIGLGVGVWKLDKGKLIIELT